MQVLENSNRIVLDPLENIYIYIYIYIYKIYVNLTVMTTVINLNHFEITQAELCLKGIYVKAFYYHIFRYF